MIDDSLAHQPPLTPNQYLVLRVLRPYKDHVDFIAVDLAAQVKADLDDLHTALVEGLRVAVPAWIRIHARTCRIEAARRQLVCAREIGARGDILQFYGGASGKVATVFNRLAEGLALAAFTPPGEEWEPAGVTYRGLHFEASTPQPEPGPRCSTWWCPSGPCRDFAAQQAGVA